MPATRDGKLWRSQFYYKDWQGVRRKKNKRGFKTKGEADEWERNFLQQQQKNLDISFENFVEIYFADMENRLRESTIINKRYVFDLKVTPYFKHKKMCEIQTSDIRAWQNELIKKGYAPTYLKSINNQLAALFNYAVRYYDLRDNPCRKAGSIGKSKADEMDFWTKQEFKEFLPSMDSKPEARMAFLLLYWTGMRIGELLALTYEDIDLEKRCITINKSYQRLNGKDKQVDDAKLTPDKHIETKYGLGTIRNLSSGCKTLLNIVKHPEKVVCVEECGPNVLKVIFAMDKIKIYMSRPSLADIPDDAIIRFNDTDVVTGSAGYNAWWSKEYERREANDL